MTTFRESATPAAVTVSSVALTVLAMSTGMVVLWWAQEVFIPIVLSVLISYALEPIVRWMMRLRVPRVVASAVVIGLLVWGFGYTVWTLSDDVTAIVAQVPEAAQNLRRSMMRGGDEPGAIEQVQQVATELQRTADEAAGRNPVAPGVQRVQVEEPTIDVREYLYWGSASAIAFAGQATLVTFFVFFLLATGDLCKRKLVKLAGPSLFNSIPYFGPVIVAAGTAVVAFLQFGTMAMAIYVSGISLVITSVEGWLLTPWLTSRMARSNEVAVFIGLIFWSFVWGIWGTLLAVPMLVVVKAFCDRIEDLKPVGELLGE